MKSNTLLTGSASRGKKTLRGTGIDSSSLGEKSARAVINSENGDAMKGGRDDLSRSITSGGKTPSY